MNVLAMHQSSLSLNYRQTKCLMLYFDLAECPISKRQHKSLYYVLYSSFRKILITNCQCEARDCVIVQLQKEQFITENK